MPSGLRTALLATPAGPVEWALARGDADGPTTLYVHGLGSSPDEVRTHSSRVPGPTAFVSLRGHGRTPEPGTPWTHSALAAQVLAVADHVGATQALGVSLGAGALLALVARQPARFDRLALLLPAALDRPAGASRAERLRRLAQLAAEGDVDAIEAQLLDEQPDHLRGRDDVRRWVRGRSARLATPAVVPTLLGLAHDVPVPDRSVLRAVGAPVLVVAQRDDPAHPPAVGVALARALPHARLEVLPAGGTWTEPRRLRALVSGFLTAGRGGESACTYDSGHVDAAARRRGAPG